MMTIFLSFKTAFSSVVASLLWKCGRCRRGGSRRTGDGGVLAQGLASGLHGGRGRRARPLDGARGDVSANRVLQRGQQRASLAAQRAVRRSRRREPERRRRPADDERGIEAGG